MKSIKPGRAPSMMGGIGSIAAAIFGIIWTFFAMSMGAPIFFALFGIIFIVMGIVQAVYHFRNATGENRYSVYDITDGEEEPDPLNETFRKSNKSEVTISRQLHNSAFCPYCGTEVEESFVYCNKCGEKLPGKE
ncbi:DUF7577 domain-containing protein [Sinanaerobacter chloroacetimidivorans]|jgi:xanthosine utilization system XapX-like protein|uniref:Zinc-ribbon domain-containing protein n=1 Tax=Sinanaerobacter chloroacetimidivorans TaxID=2818044 RepID=A0A8J7W315_9FIRM|nr:zinc-ribbon domain-containing protein [Sinanaerobacter chloroacetimidivorans]MBR0598350.1 zinc-ribbon domain-containing protein [Sinanaerobacter chloroacetimidivorans]